MISEAAALTAEQFADFSTLITTRLGIKMPEGKRVLLQSRLHRRVRELGMETVDEYHRLFFSDPQMQADELEHLLNLATTNKTDFFREPAHFDRLVDDVLPAWRKRPPSPVFRVWCAGCSSGEEAYTLAMTLLEQRRLQPFEFSLLATDVCTRVLGIAKQAIYSPEQATPIPEALKSRYLLRSRDPKHPVVRIAPEVRACVQFGQLNFLAPDFGIREMFDVIFFRNVMIYFDRATQQEVVGRMCHNLRVGGTLFIAHAETLQGLPLPLRTVGPSVYRREAGAPPS
jgi:chemotaxis protein methyltransferase CheR